MLLNTAIHVGENADDRDLRGHAVITGARIGNAAENPLIKLSENNLQQLRTTIATVLDKHH